MFKVAMIGCGGRGKAHAIGLRADKRCQVVALADTNLDAAKAVNEEFGFSGTLYTDYREMLAKEKPDVIATSLWTPLHLSVFRDCAEAGVKAVLSEKPMAPTWGECLEMASIAKRTGCQLTFSHQRRFAKGNQLARQLIADGRFGAIERMELFNPPNLLDCGTHTFDQALSFLGETPVKWVLAAVDTSSLLNWFDVKAEGMAIGTMVFENEVRATFQTGGPDMDIWGGVRVTGSDGFLEVMWDGEFKRCVIYGDPDWQPPKADDSHDDQMIAYIKNAIDCLETGSEPELTYKKALRASEIIFACYESARRRTRVCLPLEGVLDNPLHSILAEADSLK